MKIKQRFTDLYYLNLFLYTVSTQLIAGAFVKNQGVHFELAYLTTIMASYLMLLLGALLIESFWREE